GAMSDAEAEAIVRAALDAGVNLFDVAESYGEPNGLSELRLGRALRGIRDRIFLVSKVGNWGKRSGQEVPKTTADMIRLCGHACCGRLRTDHLDVLLCHEGNIADPSIYIEGFRILRDEGFIRAYGISTNSLDVLRRFHELSGGECAVVQTDYSALNRAAEAELLPYCQAERIAVMVRGPMAKGLLSGRYDAHTVFTDQVRKRWNPGADGRAEYERQVARVQPWQARWGAELPSVALHYVLNHPCAPVVIPGATRPEQIVGNAATARTPPPPGSPDQWLPEPDRA
ncbi:MAG: aldo/keto reductase, partial [Candidatus Marinimicrobia bacterium]|nr:aldo/keto reductase [Candidatus Neomarinimicrobiota bacterium]